MTSPQVGLLKSGFLPATYTPFHVDTTVGAEHAVAGRGGRARSSCGDGSCSRRSTNGCATIHRLQAKAYRDYQQSLRGRGQHDVGFARRADLRDRSERSRALRQVARRRRPASSRATWWKPMPAPISSSSTRRSGIITAASTARTTTTRCRVDLDAALAAPARGSVVAEARRRPKSLLDETLVVCFGEFGRTPGELNPGQRSRSLPVRLHGPLRRRRCEGRAGRRGAPTSSAPRSSIPAGRRSGRSTWKTSPPRSTRLWVSTGRRRSMPHRPAARSTTSNRSPPDR